MRHRLTASVSTFALAAVIGLLGAGLPAAAASSPATIPPRSGGASKDAGAIPVPSLDAAIRSEQVTAVTDAANRAVSAARAALSHDTTLQAAAQSALRSEVRSTTAAGDALVADLGRQSSERHALAGAAAASRAGASAAAAGERQLQAVAVGWYTGAIGQSAAPAAGLAAAEQTAAGDAEMSAIVAGLVTGDEAAAAALTSDRAEIASLRAEASATAKRVAYERAAVATGESLGAEGRLAAAGAAERTAAGAARLATAVAARRAALAQWADPGPAQPPSILGPSALDASQIVRWFSFSGYADLTNSSVRSLATWYLQAGAALGVRGDIAFAQAVVETAGFSSPDAVGLNNFAGIGHCDTCKAGDAFASAHAGIVAQMRLLHSYAGGCCTTWSSLTGVWATDPLYGRTILEVYQEMLAYTVAEGGA